MNIWTATEEAYKNGHRKGYTKAVNEFASELKIKMEQMCLDEDAYIPYPFDFVDKIAEKLIKKMEN